MSIFSYVASILSGDHYSPQYAKRRPVGAGTRRARQPHGNEQEKARRVRQMMARKANYRRFNTGENHA